MTLGQERLLRAGINGLTALLPREQRTGARRWLRGRLEVGQFRAADYAALSRAKSGRTWLRAMLSRLYQLRYGLPENELLEFDNFHRRDRRVPKVCFTHGHALGEALDAPDPDPRLLGQRVVFLTRHPGDVAVSEYFQSTRRAAQHKRELYGVDADMPMFDFVMRGSLGLPVIVDYLNAWERRLAAMPNARVVRYEDMRAEPVATLGSIVAFLGESFSEEEIARAVEDASFEKLKQKERENFYQNNRLAPRDADDPDSYKVRRAKVGGYRDYFDDDQVAEMEAYIERHLSQSYGYGPGPYP